MAIDAKWSDFSSLDRDRTIAAANQLLPRWVALILVIAIAWQLAKIVWLFLPGSGDNELIDAPPSQIGAAGAVRPGAAGQADISAIVAAHIFGEADADDENPQPLVQEAPEDVGDYRGGNLALKGTVASDQSDSSVAIIADQRNEEKVYAIGDVVTPGTTLHSIYSDRVILNQSGALSALKLPKDFPQSAPSIRRNTTSTRRTATRSGNVTAANAQSIQNVVAQNVSKLADVIRPTPYFVGGQQQGYRVYPGRDRKQFAALGLRPGDLIKDIDGAALTDPKQAMQIFQSLGEAEQVSVTVERNGQPEVLVLRTSQLQLDDSQ